MHFPLRSTFVAIPLEGAAKNEFQIIQKSLEPFSDSLRFQNPDSPHLTLMFWPSVMEIEFQQVGVQCQKIASKQLPFELHVNGADTFGHRGRDSVLFLTVHFSPELAELKKSCPWTDGLSTSLPSMTLRAGRAGKAFSPHITIVWVKHPERFAVKKKQVMKILKDVSFAVTVDRLRLYAEVNTRKQAALEDFLFGGERRSLRG